MCSRPLPSAPLALLLLALLAPTPAEALDEPVLRADVELGYAGYADTRRYHGMFAGAEAAYAFDDFWALRGGYGFGLHRGKGDAFQTHQVSIGARYQLDVFHYVPWIDLSPTLYAASGDGGPGDGLHAGVVAGLGFDRLLDPQWSIGFAARYHQIVGRDRFPAYLTLSVRLGHRWTFGDPFSP